MERAPRQMLLLSCVWDRPHPQPFPVVTGKGVNTIPDRKMTFVGSHAEEARLIPTSSLMHRIAEVGYERVNICQNIWSLLSGVGANVARESNC